MKKILTLLTAVLLCATLMSCKEGDYEKLLDLKNYIKDAFSSCNNNNKSFDVAVDFSFYKDGNKKEIFDTDTFEINTKIYVCVDFSITKNVDAEEVISFVVQIPYAEYYSTKDYYSGTIVPKENLYVQQDEDGSEYTIMELNQMNFTINDKETHIYHYIFEIEANQECEDADFIVRFKPENTNLTVSVNQMNDNKAKVTYTFFQGE